MQKNLPRPGYGLGLRSEYYQPILEQSPAVDWFEIISENYMVEGGKALFYLEAIAEQYPVVMHGVSLSIGGPMGWTSSIYASSKSSPNGCSRSGFQIICAGAGAMRISSMTCCLCPIPKKVCITSPGEYARFRIFWAGR